MPAKVTKQMMSPTLFTGLFGLCNGRPPVTNGADRYIRATPAQQQTARAMCRGLSKEDDVFTSCPGISPYSLAIQFDISPTSSFRLNSHQTTASSLDLEHHVRHFSPT